MTSNIEYDISSIIDLSQVIAYRTVNNTLLMRNWWIGKRIFDEELGSNNRSKVYGLILLKNFLKS